MIADDYNFHDPAIRAMVERHAPEEQYTETGAGRRILNAVTCDTCWEQWPCSPIRALRNHSKGL